MKRTEQGSFLSKASQNKISINRDPEVFGHVLKYLENSSTYNPQEMSPDMKKKID